LQKNNSWCVAAPHWKFRVEREKPGVVPDLIQGIYQLAHNVKFLSVVRAIFEDLGLWLVRAGLP